MKGIFISSAYFFNAGFPSFVSLFVHSKREAGEGTVKFLAFISGRPESNLRVSFTARKRLHPLLVEYRLTNSHVSLAYFETGCKPKNFIKLGQKHSFCFISIVSKAQPSESIPIKNFLSGIKANNSSCGFIIF